MVEGLHGLEEVVVEEEPDSQVEVVVDHAYEVEVVVEEEPDSQVEEVVDHA